MTPPAPDVDPATLSGWREDLLARMLRWATGFVGVAWAAGTGAAFWNGIWHLVVSNTLAFTFLLGLAFLPGVTFRIQAWGLLSVTTVVGVSLVFFVGPLGAAPLWLAAVPVLASFLFGLRGAVGGLTVVGVLLLLLTWPAAAGWMGTVPLASGEMSTGYDLPSWMANAGSVLGVGALLALPFALLLERAERARAVERKARVALEAAAREREALEARLRRTEKLEALGTFAGGIAHDFNNLLVPMMGEAEELLLDAPPGSPQSQSAQQILGAAQRASGLVRSILTFARGEGGESTALAPGPILHEVAQLVGRTLPPGIELEVRDESGDRLVLARAEQVHQVLMNLATNGVLAMVERGGSDAGRPEGAFDRLTLTAEAAGQELLLRVRDTGVGMDPEIAARAVDPFFTTRPSGGGTGLGLSTVHGIVEGLGGTLHLESHPGAGTLVEVRLPAVRAPAMARGGAEGERPLGGVPGGSNPPPRAYVLLVDDDARVRETLRRLLVRLGVAVTEAGNGVDALAKGGRVPEDAGPAASPPPWHLVITDHAMPEMDGVALARRLRAAWPELPLILATGYLERALAEEGSRALFSAVITKPFGKVELEEALAGVLPRLREGEPPGSGSVTTS